jgi:putative PIN family toxin of toxin-antitoxin system
LKSVLDNNILARAYPRSTGPARRLFLRIAANRGDLILSRETCEELGRVLLYPRLLRRSGFTQLEMAAYLSEIASVATIVVPAEVPKGLLRDPEDAPVLGTALAGDAEVLCTNDLDFFDEKVLAFAAEHGIRIMGDLEFLALLDQRDSHAPGE